MNDLKKVFDIVGEKTWVRITAKLKSANSSAEVCVQKLWNGKFAIFSPSSNQGNSNYKCFESEEAFRKDVDILAVTFTNKGACPIELQDTVTSLLVI